MAITIPTVDEFTESTVMLVIREIAEYICGNNGLVAQINNNDITGFTSSYTNNVLKIDATKGDGSTLPVCNVTIEGGSSTGNPYPTGVSGTVGSNGNITFTITMSSGSPLTTTIDMNYFASTADLSDLQEQVTGLALTSSGNTMSINGTSAPIVNSISGSVSNGNLKISVNGVESVDIPLPESSMGEITLTVNVSKADNLVLTRGSSVNISGSKKIYNISADEFSIGYTYKNKYINKPGNIDSFHYNYLNGYTTGGLLYYKYTYTGMEEFLNGEFKTYIDNNLQLTDGNYDISIEFGDVSSSSFYSRTIEFIVNVSVENGVSTIESYSENVLGSSIITTNAPLYIVTKIYQNM